MSRKTFVCATHGHCFDGLSSAVLFRELAQKEHPELEFRVLGCGYGARQRKPSAELLDGEENAILDFRYAQAPRLTYYFDHHKTAFVDPQDRGDFERRRAESPERFVFDPAATSCTLLLSRELSQSHGLDFSRFSDLIHWADVVDSARFESARAATDPDNPVLGLVSVVEQFGDDELFGKLVPRLGQEGLEAVAKSPLVRKKYDKIAEEHRSYTELVRRKGELRGRVVLLDLTDHKIQAVTKFAPYAEFPAVTYSVVVALLSSGVRLSVGYNPWSGAPREHDISAICARYGGGGHPVVGGIALPKEDLERGRQIARAIAEELA